MENNCAILSAQKAEQLSAEKAHWNNLLSALIDSTLQTVCEWYYLNVFINLQRYKNKGSNLYERLETAVNSMHLCTV